MALLYAFAALALPATAPSFLLSPLKLAPKTRLPLSVRPDELSSSTLSLCVRTSTCPEMMLTTGNPSASTVVVFLHTTFDAGWGSFYRLFDGWSPKGFHAVALDLPGGPTVFATVRPVRRLGHLTTAAACRHTCARPLAAPPPTGTRGARPRRSPRR